jgi:hypothetical protein
MAAARKKKPLEPEVEAKVNELLGAVKRPRTLQDLHAALVALPRSGEAGAEAMRRLQPPFKNFGGATPGEDEEAISWDKTHLLVVGDEGLEGARLVPRRGAAPEVPQSEERPRASNDGEELQEAPEGDEGAEGHAEGVEGAEGIEGAEGSRGAPGADPEELRVALVEACKASKIDAKRIEVVATPRGGRVTFVPGEGPKKVMALYAETWGQGVSVIVTGLVEVITAVGE